MNNLLLCLFALGMLCEACCLLDRLNDRPGMPLPRVRAPSQGQPSLGDRLRGGLAYNCLVLAFGHAVSESLTELGA
eukprot:695828-Hanusia_phi.AAC.1